MIVSETRDIPFNRNYAMCFKNVNKAWKNKREHNFSADCRPGRVLMNRSCFSREHLRFAWAIPFALFYLSNQAGASLFEHPDALIFPQIADGGGYKTSLLLTNSSDTDTDATVSFVSDSGTPLVLTVGGVTSDSFRIRVPARGAAKLITSGSPATPVTGWANVTTTPPVDLNGNSVFQVFIGSTLFCEASVPAVRPVSSVDFYADEEAGFTTGFAIANPGTSPSLGTLTLWSQDGTAFGTYTISLGAGNHMATYLWQIITGAPSGRAEIALTSGYVAATALRFNTSNVFSAMSVGQPGYSPAGSASLFSPNGGVRSRLIAEIARAQSTIDIAIYSFTADDLSAALIEARSRGVAIRIIADASQADGSGSEIAKLEGLGFALRRTAGIQNGIMHDKYMIIDGRLLVTGSYNWSASAESYNFENAIFIQGSSIIQSYEADFDRIWGK